MSTDVTFLQDAIVRVLEVCDSHKGSYVCLSNVHMCMEVFHDPKFRDIVNSADLVVPDVKPIAVAQRLLGAKIAKQVRGQDVMNAVCASSVPLSLKIGLYGGSAPSVLSRVVEKLQEAYPCIDICFTYCPPFRPLNKEEDDSIIRMINESGVNILFVGIGCPKQEKWMYEHREKIRSVMFGVGAAYDFISGSKKHAPRWVQSIGMEWAFRLACEPRRLAKRYLKQNPRFIFYFLHQWLLGRKFD